MNSTRRSVLKAGIAGLAAASAGCLSEPGDDSETAGDGPTGYAALFTLWDWSEEITGDGMAFENVLSVGEAGHGWNPPGDLTLDVAESDAFVYLDTPEFSWAQNVASQLEEEDVAALDAMKALESDQLLSFNHDHEGEDHDEESHEGEDHDEENHEEEDHEEEDHEEDDHNEEDHEEEDHEEEDHNEEDHDEDDHQEGEEFHDPHVWIDPVLAQEMVDWLADEFAGIDPDNREMYRENADEYNDRLDDIDDQLQQLVDESRLDLGIFAGHNSFQYVEERYGFRLHSPQSVTPDAEPSADDIAETIELVEDNDIDVILYDPLETADDGPPPLAQRILESTPASEALPLTSGDGTTAEWQDNGWGWVEQMAEINLPSLRAALGAE